MKENFIKNNNIKTSAISNLGIFIQFILIVLVSIFAIISSFIPEFFVLVKVLLGLILLIMSYNNYSIFKRKGFTVIYGIAGLATIIITIIDAYGI